MKKTTFLLIIVYLLVFLLAAWWFYNKYFRDLVTPKSNTTTITSGYVLNKTIFYTTPENHYLLNSDNLNKSMNESSAIKVESNGQVQTVSLDSKKEFLVFDSITKQNSTTGSNIWKVSFSDNHLEKIFSEQTPGFENYSNFRNPQMSATGNYLAFVATSNNIDDLFVWNVTSNNVINLTNQTVKLKISSLTWSPTEVKVYYSTTDNTNSNVNLIDLERVNKQIASLTGQIVKMSATKDRLIVANLTSNSISNLNYILYAKSNVVTPITDLKSPKTINNFDVSSNSQKVVYEVEDTTAKTNDLYLVNTDGTNLLQLTTDGQSKYGIFASTSDKIAYWVKGSGIYTIGIAKENQQKILNFDQTINNIALWR